MSYNVSSQVAPLGYPSAIAGGYGPQTGPMDGRPDPMTGSIAEPMYYVPEGAQDAQAMYYTPGGDYSMSYMDNSGYSDINSGMSGEIGSVQGGGMITGADTMLSAINDLFIQAGVDPYTAQMASSSVSQLSMSQDELMLTYQEMLSLGPDGIQAVASELTGMPIGMQPQIDPSATIDPSMVDQTLVDPSMVDPSMAEPAADPATQKSGSMLPLALGGAGAAGAGYLFLKRRGANKAAEATAAGLNSVATKTAEAGSKPATSAASSVVKTATDKAKNAVLRAPVTGGGSTAATSKVTGGIAAKVADASLPVGAAQRKIAEGAFGSTKGRIASGFADDAARGVSRLAGSGMASKLGKAGLAVGVGVGIGALVTNALNKD